MAEFSDAFDTSDESYTPGSDDEEEAGAAGEERAPSARRHAATSTAAAPAGAARDAGNDDGEEEGGGDGVGEEQGAGEFDEDGMEEEESGGEDVRRPVSIQEFLAWRLLGRVPESMRGREDARRRYTPYESAVPRALSGHLAASINAATAAAGPWRRNGAAHFDSELDASMDASLLAARAAPYGKQVRQSLLAEVASDPAVAAAVTHLGPHRSPSAAAAASGSAGDADGGDDGDGPAAAVKRRRRPGSACCGGGGAAAAPADAAAASAAAAAGVPLVGAPLPDGYLSGCPVVPAPRMVLRREQGEAAGVAGGWGGAQRRHMSAFHALPRHPHALVDSLDSRAYIGQFSADGQFFVAAFQDRRVRLYDVDRGWRLRKDITTRMCRWTITDTSISPDQRFVIYSSIIPVVHLVEVGTPYDAVSSIANITQVHEALNFDDTTNGPNGNPSDFRMGRSFGIWSVQWSGDGREIVAGTNDQSVVVMDAETRRVVARAEGHEDDVNAVTYADASPNVIVSGSDDTRIKVWDRRTMPAPPSAASAGGAAASTNRRPRPVGVLVGHTEGLTHLHARGDGRHVLSNAKDQTAKLWDLRMTAAGGSLRDPAVASRLSRQHVPQFNWDYRWQEYPAAGRVVRHPHDASVQTYRGHSVQHTLIRAYFSPLHSTGGRFVYTGSVDGGVHVYDVVTGQEVEGSPLRLHRKLVRDVSWHPYDPVLATVSWDGTVARWDAVPPPPGSNALEVPRHDAYGDY